MQLLHPVLLHQGYLPGQEHRNWQKRQLRLLRLQGLWDPLGLLGR